MSNLIRVDRTFNLTKSVDDQTGEFEGYASVFNTEDHHGDTIVKGAFKKGLQKLAREKRLVKMLWNHDRYQPIGVYKEVDEDDTGLYVRGKLTLGVQKADETRLLMKDEAVDSMSIGGYVVKEKVIDQRTYKRELHEIELREISPVTFPALDAARIVSVKSLGETATLRQIEAYLRDEAGFSQKEAKRLISLIQKADSPQRDVAGDQAIKAVREAIEILNK